MFNIILIVSGILEYILLGIDYHVSLYEIFYLLHQLTFAPRRITHKTRISVAFSLVSLFSTRLSSSTSCRSLKPSLRPSSL